MNDHQSLAAFCAETIGDSHIERGVPCQDKAATWLTPHPAIAVLDGKGSAERSDVGSLSGTHAVGRTLDSQQEKIQKALESVGALEAENAWVQCALTFYRNALASQIRHARNDKNHPKEYEFTMSVIVVGEKWTGWLTVGDSPLVAVSQGVAGLLSCPEITRYANETHFVSISDLKATAMQTGVLPTEGLHAVFAMSDGTASRFIQLTQHIPGKVIHQLIPILRQPNIPEGTLEDLLKKDFWESVTGDDRSLAILLLPELGEGMFEMPSILGRASKNTPLKLILQESPPKKQLIYGTELVLSNNHLRLQFPHCA